MGLGRNSVYWVLKRCLKRWISRRKKISRPRNWLRRRLRLKSTLIIWPKECCMSILCLFRPKLRLLMFRSLGSRVGSSSWFRCRVWGLRDCLFWRIRMKLMLFLIARTRFFLRLICGSIRKTIWYPRLIFNRRTIFSGFWEGFMRPRMRRGGC